MASQKLKSDTTIKELETEITALTDQLIQSHQQNTHYDELMKQTAILQNSMHDLESQNDMLRRTIESYESRFNELQVNLEKVQFEVKSLLLKSEKSLTLKKLKEMDYFDMYFQYLFGYFLLLFIVVLELFNMY